MSVVQCFCTPLNSAKKQQAAESAGPPASLEWFRCGLGKCRLGRCKFGVSLGGSANGRRRRAACGRFVARSPDRHGRVRAADFQPGITSPCAQSPTPIGQNGLNLKLSPARTRLASNEIPNDVAGDPQAAEQVPFAESTKRYSTFAVRFGVMPTSTPAPAVQPNSVELSKVAAVDGPLHIAEGAAGRAVNQHAIERIADAAADGAQPVAFGFAASRQRYCRPGERTQRPSSCL